MISKEGQGLSGSTNLVCLRSTDSGASGSHTDDNLLNRVDGKRFCVPTDDEILANHGPYIHLVSKMHTKQY